jgi:hypothetical protein
MIQLNKDITDYDKTDVPSGTSLDITRSGEPYPIVPTCDYSGLYCSYHLPRLASSGLFQYYEVNLRSTRG